MSKLAGFGALIATFGAAVVLAESFAHAQVVGAVQYPPASVGKDAQPPPPAGMVPQSVSPRRLELGIIGSSQPPAGSLSSSRPWRDTAQHGPSLGSSLEPTSGAGAN